MAQPDYSPYEPQLAPVRFADDVWIVDGPEVSYALGGLRIPCPTRMTLVALADGTLWVHSPVQLTDALRDAVTALGPVSALIAPNCNHFIHVEQWASAFPSAQVYAAPGLAAKPGFPPHLPLDRKDTFAWEAEIANLWLGLGDFSESVFFHRGSKTLIVTDLLMDYEPQRIRHPVMRMFLRLGGATGPTARPSVDMRIALRKFGTPLKAGLDAMIALGPERIILAHGQCFDCDGVEVLKQAFPRQV